MTLLTPVNVNPNPNPSTSKVIHSPIPYENRDLSTGQTGPLTPTPAADPAQAPTPAPDLAGALLATTRTLFATQALRQALLADAQLLAFPDSVFVTASQVLDWADEAPPPWFHTESNTRRQDLLDMVKSEVDRAWARLLFSAQAGEAQARLRARRLSWIATALSLDAGGLFYQCCRRDDGTYRYRGFRYGVQPHEYQSGYPDNV